MMRGALDLMRADRGYRLGRFVGLISHVSTAIDPADIERRMAEMPEIAFRRAAVAYNVEIERIKAREPERALLIGRRMLSIVQSLRPADMTQPLTFSEQEAFAQGFFLELNAVKVGGVL